MKFKKIMAAILAAICLISMFASCNKKEGPAETEVNEENETTQKRYKATVQFKVVNYDGREVYSTPEDEPYEYDSAYYEPTVIKFVEDYAFMNDQEFGAKFYSKTGTKEYDSIKKISITKRKKTVDYEEGKTVISKVDGSQQTTFWVCLINGEEVKSMKNTVIKDGDVVVLQLAYPGSDETKKETLPDLSGDGTK